MARPVLYDYWRSSASYRVRIALNLKAIAYDRVPVDLVAAAHRSAEHLAVNPQGLVPALKIDGNILTQSLAIVEYLDETRPEPALLPGDPLARAYVRRLALAVACDIHPVSNLGVLGRVGALAGPQARAAWNRDNIAGGLEALETMLDNPGFAGRFCHGTEPSLADCALVPQLYNAARWGVALDDLPRITRVAAACAGLDAFRNASAEALRPGADPNLGKTG